MQEGKQVGSAMSDTIWREFNLALPVDADEIQRRFQRFAEVLGIQNYQYSVGQPFTALGLNAPRTDEEQKEFAAFINVVAAQQRPAIASAPAAQPDVSMVMLAGEADQIVISRAELKDLGVQSAADVIKQLTAYKEIVKNCISNHSLVGWPNATDAQKMEIICKHGKRVLDMNSWSDTAATRFLGVVENINEDIKNSNAAPGYIQGSATTAVADLLQILVQERLSLAPYLGLSTDQKAKDSPVAKFLKLVDTQRLKGAGLFEGRVPFWDDLKLLLDVFNDLSPGASIYTKLRDHASHLKKSMDAMEKPNIEEYIQFVTKNQPMFDELKELVDAVKDNRFNPKTVVPLLRRLSQAGIQNDKTFDDQMERMNSMRIFSQFCLQATVAQFQQAEKIVQLATTFYRSELQNLSAMLLKLGPQAQSFRDQFATREKKWIETMDTENKNRDVFLDLEYLTRFLERDEFTSFETGMALLSQAVVPRKNDLSPAFSRWFALLQKFGVTLLSPSSVANDTVSQAVRSINQTFTSLFIQIDTLLQETFKMRADVLEGATGIVVDRVASMSSSLKTIIVQYSAARSARKRAIADQIALDTAAISRDELKAACEGLDQGQRGALVEIISKIALKDAEPVDNKEVLGILEQGMTTLVTESKDGALQRTALSVQAQLAEERARLSNAAVFISQVASIVNDLLSANLGDEKGNRLQIRVNDITAVTNQVVKITDALTAVTRKILLLQRLEQRYGNGRPIDEFMNQYESDKKLLEVYMREVANIAGELGVSTSDVADPATRMALVRQNALAFRKQVDNCRKIQSTLFDLYMYIQNAERAASGQLVLEEKREEKVETLEAGQVSSVVATIKQIYKSYEDFTAALDDAEKKNGELKYKMFVESLKKAAKPGANKETQSAFVLEMLRADALAPDGGLARIPDPDGIEFSSWKSSSDPREISFASLFEFMMRVAGHCGLNVDALMFSPALHVRMSSPTFKFISVTDDLPPGPDRFETKSAPVTPRLTTQAKHRKADDAYTVKAIEYLMQMKGGVIDDASDAELDTKSRQNLRAIAIKAMRRLTEVSRNNPEHYKDGLVHYLRSHAYATILASYNILQLSSVTEKQFKGVSLHEVMHSPGLTIQFALLCAFQLMLTMERSPKEAKFSRQQYEELVSQSNSAVYFISQFKRTGPYNWSI